MTKLHIFDMDGTLLRGSACLELSRHMGQIDAVDAIEARWAVGDVGHVEFYELCLPLWTGLTDTDVDAVFDATDWLGGVREVWHDIALRGEHSAVITLSPQFFADRLLRWGVGSVHGAAVFAGVDPDPGLVLTPESKPGVAAMLMERYGVAEEDCVAYGDSSSDVPLFRRLPNTVAVNASESLREVAAVGYDGPDLRGAYRAGRRLLAASRLCHSGAGRDAR
jgi:phosphoserine phosphatase